jgi:hypothetical protein
MTVYTEITMNGGGLDTECAGKIVGGYVFPIRVFHAASLYDAIVKTCCGCINVKRAIFEKSSNPGVR